MDGSTIENNYKHHPPDGEAIRKHMQLRQEFKKVAYLVNELCPESREKSIAMTKLEEALMWSNASIARNEGE